MQRSQITLLSVTNDDTYVFEGSCCGGDFGSDSPASGVGDEGGHSKVRPRGIEAEEGVDA